MIHYLGHYQAPYCSVLTWVLRFESLSANYRDVAEEHKDAFSLVPNIVINLQVFWDGKYHLDLTIMFQQLVIRASSMIKLELPDQAKSLPTKSLRHPLPGRMSIDAFIPRLIRTFVVLRDLLFSKGVVLERLDCFFWIDCGGEDVMQSELSRENILHNMDGAHGIVGVRKAIEDIYRDLANGQTDTLLFLTDVAEAESDFSPSIQ